MLQYIAGKRLAAGRLTVVDATNVQPEARRALVDAGPRVRRAAGRDRARPAGTALRRSGTPAGPTGTSARTWSAASATSCAAALRGLAARGLPHRARAAHARGGRRRRHPHGPALYNDLRARDTARSTSSATCTAAGPNSRSCWQRSATRSTATTAGGPPAPATPSGRRAVFVGDLVDRGPDTPGVLRLVMGMVAAGTAFCVAGNHEDKLLRALRGKNVKRQPRPGRVDGAAGRRDRGVPGRRGAIPRRPDQPLRAGRRDGWWWRTPA